MAEVARKGVDAFKIRCENIVRGEVVKDLGFDFVRYIYIYTCLFGAEYVR